MFTPSTHRHLGLRAATRFAVLVLCLNLILPLAWKADCNAAAGSEVITQRDGARPALGRKTFSGFMPATLSEAPSVSPRTGLGRQALRTSPPDDSKQLWAALSPAQQLPSLRILPLDGEIVVPSFLMPSEYGLISFALPPPSLS